MVSLLYFPNSYPFNATLTGVGLVVLGTQDGVFRRTNEWYWSHYYIGLTVALLMVFSLAIIQDIYQDRSNRWRTIHIVLNSIAVLLFIDQGMTGTRDLLEIPLSWQEPYIYSCDFTNKTCPKPCAILQLFIHIGKHEEFPPSHWSSTCFLLGFNTIGAVVYCSQGQKLPVLYLL